MIPYDAETLVVEVDVQPDAPEHTLGFAFHGGDTFERTLLAPSSTEGTVLIYEINMALIRNDDPYNLQSVWELWLYPTDQDDVFAGDITMTATIYKDN